MSSAYHSRPYAISASCQSGSWRTASIVERVAGELEAVERRRVPAAGRKHRRGDEVGQDRADEQRQRREEPERHQFRGEDLPSSHRPREQELVRPFGVLRRDDVAAEDGDEEGEEQEAGGVGERAHDQRRGRLLGIDVAVEIELQALDLRAHRARPRLVDRGRGAAVLACARCAPASSARQFGFCCSRSCRYCEYDTRQRITSMIATTIAKRWRRRSLSVSLRTRSGNIARHSKIAR